MNSYQVQQLKVSIVIIIQNFNVRLIKTIKKKQLLNSNLNCELLRIQDRYAIYGSDQARV